MVFPGCFKNVTSFSQGDSVVFQGKFKVDLSFKLDTLKHSK